LKSAIFETSEARDLDLESSHTAYRHASLINLYAHTPNFIEIRQFLWTEDRRTDGRTY